jgi:hypothetical protein
LVWRFDSDVFGGIGAGVSGVTHRIASLKCFVVDYDDRLPVSQVLGAVKWFRYGQLV